MLQLGNLRGIMESENHFKNGASLKSLTSRENNLCLHKEADSKLKLDMKKGFLILITTVCFGISVNAQPGTLPANKNKAMVAISEILNEYDLTLPELSAYFCQYVGGHPERDKESFRGIFVGSKNGKIVFFEFRNITFKTISLSDYWASMEGPIKPDKMKIQSGWTVRHLFDIPSDNIIDIGYSDLYTESNLSDMVGNRKEGDASVIIVWSDGRFTNSTEFRIVAYRGEAEKTNKRGNALSNALKRMAK